LTAMCSMQVQFITNAQFVSVLFLFASCSVWCQYAYVWCQCISCTNYHCSKLATKKT